MYNVYVLSHKNCDSFAIKSFMILSCLTIIIYKKTIAMNKSISFESLEIVLLYF